MLCVIKAKGEDPLFNESSMNWCGKRPKTM